MPKIFKAIKNKDVKNRLSNFFFLLLGAITVNSEIFVRVLLADAKFHENKTRAKWVR